MVIIIDLIFLTWAFKQAVNKGCKKGSPVEEI